MKTQAEVNLKGISDNKKFAETNDPNYRFVNFFNLRESNAYTIGAINDTKKKTERKMVCRVALDGA